MSLKIIGGEFGGRNLQSVKGLGTRPLLGQVREALFNILGSWIEGKEVWDLFAGTGSSGIEALSRGARRVLFVEKQNQALRVLRANLDLFDPEVKARTHVLRTDAWMPVPLLVEGETTEVPSVKLVERPRWPVTSGGVAYAREGGGIIFGLGPVFSLSEWGFEGDRLHTGFLRPGPHVLMSRSGFLTTLDALPADGATIEVGTASITLQRPENRDVPPFFVLPEGTEANPIALHWGRRMFAESDDRPRDALKLSPLHAGRYVVIVEGRGVVKTLDLADGEELTLPFEEWMPAEKDTLDTRR